MSLSEFEIIRRFFARSGHRRDDVSLGIGDDCALLRVPADRELAVSIDTLVEGVHFEAGADPESLGYKSLAVNLSDLAAMGAEPAWFTLSLTLPFADIYWLEAFSSGLLQLAGKYGVDLIGGDTTRGPLSVTIQTHGFVEPGKALLRSTARPGDQVWVTGTLGDAGLAIHVGQRDKGAKPGLAQLRARLHRPEPRIREALAIREIARAAIDVSDGLAADLGHILDDSGVGATIRLDDIPLSPPVRDYLAATRDWALPVASGDDYELCFTAPADAEADLREAGKAFDAGFTCVGVIETEPGLRWLQRDGTRLPLGVAGYRHFSGDESDD